jgi:hypothetical protein
MSNRQSGVLRIYKSFNNKKQAQNVANINL